MGKESLWKQLQGSKETYEPLTLEKLRSALSELFYNRVKSSGKIPAIQTNKDGVIKYYEFKGEPLTQEEKDSLRDDVLYLLNGKED